MLIAHTSKDNVRGITVLLFCAAFVAISFFATEQPENNYVLIKAEKLARTAGTPLPAK
jgi:hypothetical protein